MKSFFGVGSFERAYRSSQKHWEARSFDVRYGSSEIALAEGIFVGVLTMAPFWLSVGLLIHHFTQ